MQTYHEPSDDISEWLMIKGETNQSMRIADKLRTMEDLSKFMDKNTDYVFPTLWKSIVPLKLLGKTYISL